MATYEARKKGAILDWTNEKKYQEKVLKSATASATAKEKASARIKEADAMIKKLKK